MRFIITILLAILPLRIFAQEAVYQPQDIEIFNRIVASSLPKKDLPAQELLIHVARQFLGTPYTASTLENDPSTEVLTVNLRETDCILFVEMCLALTQTIKSDEPTFETYCSNIRQLRYRDGKVDGYDSRLHYTSEWILQNSKRGLIEEISSRYGEPLHQTFSFMSSHPDSYPQLRESNSMVRRIRRIEQHLDAQGPYYYIPKEKVCQIAAEIPEGCIVCFVTKVEGLDISHVGLTYLQNHALHFIHASSREKKVVIEKKTLCDYNRYGIRLLKVR